MKQVMSKDELSAMTKVAAQNEVQLQRLMETRRKQREQSRR